MRRNLETSAKSVEDVLENKMLKTIIANVIEQSEIYAKSKKELQKTIAKAYINRIRSCSEDIFDSMGINIRQKNLEKIALFVRYNKNISVTDFIKQIKKLDNISLGDLIILENELNAILLAANIYGGKENEEGFADEYKKIVDTVKQTDIMLLTIRLLKYIKFDYLSYNINYFDKDDKPKKVFVDKKINTSVNNFYLVDKYANSFNNILDYLDIEYFKTGQKLSMVGLSRYAFEYFSMLNYNTDVITDNYNKLILSEKYLTYINDRITNPIEIHKVPLDLDMLFHRKVLMPKSGVLLLVENDNAIESILLKEIYKFEINHFVAITRYKDGKELVNTFELCNGGFRYRMCRNYIKEDKYNLIDYLCHFLIGNDDERLKDMKYEVISPTYWKYRDRDYKSENDEIDHRGIVVKREFEIEIAPFIRKIHGEASSEAKSLAKKLGVILEDGYTIVRPHTRHYNKVK